MRVEHEADGPGPIVMDAGGVIESSVWIDIAPAQTAAVTMWCQPMPCSA